jgi:hypothetical protein
LRISGRPATCIAAKSLASFSSSLASILAHLFESQHYGDFI